MENPGKACPVSSSHPVPVVTLSRSPPSTRILYPATDANIFWLNSRPYWVHEQIGHGGFGDVFKAELLVPRGMEVAWDVKGNPTLKQSSDDCQRVSSLSGEGTALSFSASSSSAKNLVKAQNSQLVLDQPGHASAPGRLRWVRQHAQLMQASSMSRPEKMAFTYHAGDERPDERFLSDAVGESVGLRGKKFKLVGGVDIVVFPHRHAARYSRINAYCIIFLVQTHCYCTQQGHGVVDSEDEGVTRS